MSLTQTTVTIASGTSLSPAVALGSKLLVGVAMPAGWDAADLTFQASIDGATWLEMQSVSAAIDYKAAASQFVAVDPTLWRGINQVKVRSGTLGTPVNQTADRVLTLITA